MPAPDNSDPLAKQLLQLNLEKGMNERERAETADPQTTFSRVENLYQEQGGAWIKRYGSPILGGVTTDDTGAALTGPTKLLRLGNGLGMIGNLGKFYQYISATSRFTQKDEVPDFNMSGADQIVSSGAAVAATIISVASCTKFHAMVYDAGSGGGNTGIRLSFFDRTSGAVVKNVNLAQVVFAAVSSPLTSNVKIVFVGDRYLHVYATVNGGTGSAGGVYDTAGTPIAPVNLVNPFINTGVTGTLADRDATTDRSFFLVNNGAVSTIGGMLNNGTFVTSSTTATGPVVGLSVVVAQNKVWYITATQKGALSTTALTTVTNAESPHGATSPSTFVANGISGMVIISTSSQAFGSSTIPRITISGIPGISGIPIVIDGWNTASAPWTDGTNYYIQLVKYSGLQVVAHVVAKLSYPGYSAATGWAGNYWSVRLAATLEPHLGVANSVPLKYFPLSTGEMCPAVAVQTVARGYAYCMYSLKPYFHAACTQALFGGENYLSGASHCILGSNRIHECGFVDMPVVNSAASAAAGPTGSFKHIAVYRYVDESGAVTWSRTSVLASTTVAAKGIDLVISPPSVTMRDLQVSGALSFSQLGSVEVYRTKSGGTAYYLCGSSQTGTPSVGLLTQLINVNASSFYGFTDTLTDAQLALQPTLFRQPGTANAAVDRYPPPGGNLLCQHKDRLFTTDPYGVRVYYSSFFVDGETAWYNPVFSFFVHGGSGPVTAMVSMDGRLFVFKRNGIFVIDGDGPAEGGVSGNEFSPPLRLATEYGCVDQRSMVVTTDGIMYRSPRGIEMLTRSLQVKWIGERVQNTVNRYKKTTGAVLDGNGRVHFGLSTDESGSSTQINTNGMELVYDFTVDAWSACFYTDITGTANRTSQDMTMANIYSIGEVLCRADPQGCVVYGLNTSGLDRGAFYVGWTIETVWIRMGQQMRQRFTKAMLLAKKQSGSNHRIVISVAYNYVDAYTQVAVFEPGSINPSNIEELMVNLNNQQALSVRLLIQEQAPTDTGTFPVGTGRGCDLLGIAVEAAPIQGAPRLAVGQKA